MGGIYRGREHESDAEFAEAVGELVREMREREIPLVRRSGQQFESEEQKVAVQTFFLEEFARRGILKEACARAGISRMAIYRWIEVDAAFAAAYEEALEEVNDVLRREAHRRAVEGTPEYVVSMGKLVMDNDGKPIYNLKYSDALLTLLMRARMPEYRESKNVDVTQTTTINTSHQVTLDMRGMSAEELSQVRQIAQAMKEREAARIEERVSSSFSASHAVDTDTGSDLPAERIVESEVTNESIE